jgi:hypothetical protein
VRDTLLRPILAGRIEHEGELISRVADEPVIVERDWLRLRAMIDATRGAVDRGAEHLVDG